jgi:molybdopterin/thiamine biosynthesis adenylyltransferase
MNDPRLEFLGRVSDEQQACFLDILETTAIQIVADYRIATRADVRIAALRGADLMSRLFEHVDIDIDAPWVNKANQSLLGRQRTRQRPERTVTVGLGDVAADLHFGYSAGELRVGGTSTRHNCEPGDPAAILAGPVMAAEVFKLTFERHIPSILREEYVVPLGLTGNARRFTEREIAVDLLVAGGGSAGFAFTDALLNLEVTLRGRVAFVDNGTTEERNAVKYQSLDLATARSGRAKVEILKERLLAVHPGLDVEIHNGTIETYGGPPAEIAIVSMDNVAARRSAQEQLSRDIVNIAIAGTELEVFSLTYGNTGCLYCYYRSNPEETQSFPAIAAHVGLPVERVAQLMHNNGPLLPDDVIRCAKHRGNAIELQQFIGQPLRSMIPRLPYSQAEVRMPGGSLRVTTAFASAMAGSLGAVEVLKAAQEEFRGDRRSVAIDMLGIFHDLSRRELLKLADCDICGCEFRRAEYAKRWQNAYCA